MEISLEKIELVKDRTGVNYKEAKDALIRADGSVVDAIIAIEEEIDLVPKSKAGDQASQIIERMKEIVRKGNISKIVIKKDGETVLNIPLNLGIIGAIWVFWPTVAATVVALGMKCTIDLVKDDGEVINLSSKAAQTFEGVRENCSVIADDLKEKSGGAFSQVRERAAEVISRAKNDEDEYDEEFDESFDPENLTVDIQIDDDDDDDYDDDYFNFDDFAEIPEEEEFFDLSETESLIEGIMEETEEPQAVEEAAEAEVSEEITEEEESAPVDEDVQKAGEKFEEAIAGYKKKKGAFRFF